ncbi:MAG TPA: alpha/beta hydrolase [Solirubrobacterales bacterium]
MTQETTQAVKLFFTDSGGDGQPIVLIHGWTCDSHDWNWQLPALTESYRVIAPDLRGHGRSELPDSGFHPRDYAVDVAALLTDLDTGPVIAIGHSMGGSVASFLAVEHPELVRAVVVVDPAYGFDQEGAEAALAFCRELEATDSMQPALDRIAGGEGGDPVLAEWHRRRALGTPHSVVVGSVLEVHGTLDSFVNKPQIDELLRQRQMPVFAVHSNAAAAEWEGGLSSNPQSASLAIEGRGHWLHQEDPETFNRCLLEWLSQLD